MQIRLDRGKNRERVLEREREKMANYVCAKQQKTDRKQETKRERLEKQHEREREIVMMEVRER